MSFQNTLEKAVDQMSVQELKDTVTEFCLILSELDIDSEDALKHVERIYHERVGKNI